LCQEEYSLSEAIDQLPPALTVVNEMGMSAATGEAPASEWSRIEEPSSDSEASDFELEPVESSSAPAFNFEGGAASGPKPSAAIASAGRARKKKGTPVKSIVGIVLGGLLAFPIAQLILFALPGDLKRDPFDIGPVIAKYIPQIVPERFHGDASSAAEPSPDAGASGFSEFANSGNEGEFELPQFNNTADNTAAQSGQQPLPTDESESNQNATDNSTQDAAELAMEEPTEGADVFSNPLEVPNLDVPGLTVAPPTGLPAELDPPTKSTAPGESTSSAEPEPDSETEPFKFGQPLAEVANSEVGKVRNAPAFATEDVLASFSGALEANVTLDTTDEGASAELRAAKQEFYQSLSKFGEVLTFADQSDEMISEELAESIRLLMTIGKQQDKLALISQVESRWLSIKRPNDGILLYGTVESVAREGAMFETQVKLASKDERVISLISMSDPSEHFEPEHRVLVLGTILEEPAKNLSGYEGDAELVILDGLHVTLPAE
jgi:hypothetical protein